MLFLVTHRSDRKSLDRAVSVAERFAGSEHAALLDTYGWVLYKSGRNDEALAVLGRRSQRLQLPRNFVTIWQWPNSRPETARMPPVTWNLRSPVGPITSIEEAKAALTSM